MNIKKYLKYFSSVIVGLWIFVFAVIAIMMLSYIGNRYF